MSLRFLKKQLASDPVKKSVNNDVVKFWLRVRSKLVRAVRCVKWLDYRIETVITKKKKRR